MSSFCEEIECPKCGGLFHYSTDNRDPYGNYGYCLDCGYGYSTKESWWTLEELNEERCEGWELPPLEKLERQQSETEKLGVLLDAYRTIVRVSGDEDELRYANEQVRLNQACIESIQKGK